MIQLYKETLFLSFLDGIVRIHLIWSIFHRPKILVESNNWFYVPNLTIKDNPRYYKQHKNYSIKLEIP